MKCIYPFISMTTVNKCSEAFANNTLPYKITELNPSVTKRGCSFGIEIPCRYTENAEEIMRRYGIKHGDMIKS